VSYCASYRIYYLLIIVLSRHLLYFQQNLKISDQDTNIFVHTAQQPVSHTSARAPIIVPTVKQECLLCTEERSTCPHTEHTVNSERGSKSENLVEEGLQRILDYMNRLPKQKMQEEFMKRVLKVQAEHEREMKSDNVAEEGLARILLYLGEKGREEENQEQAESDCNSENLDMDADMGFARILAYMTQKGREEENQVSREEELDDFLEYFSSEAELDVFLDGFSIEEELAIFLKDWEEEIDWKTENIKKGKGKE